MGANIFYIESTWLHCNVWNVA